MAAPTSRDPNNFVVDMVCDVCRIEGFQVEKNVQAGQSDAHVVRIVASRPSGSTAQKVAFECWEGDRQVNGHEVEAFVVRLRNAGLSGGIYVSPKGFTGDAEFMARKLGVELWDLARLKQHVERISSTEGDQVPGTLPVSRAVASLILAHGLENNKALRLASMPKLEFRPYYFADFSLMQLKKKIAKGVIVFDAVDGRECDAGLFEGQVKDLPGSGLFLDCLELEPSTGSMPQLPPELEMKNSVTVAPAVATESAIRSKLSDILLQSSNAHPDDVSIPTVRLLHIPIITVELKAASRSYRKILQGATGRMIWDETRKCLTCGGPSRAVCEDCGAVTCQDHARLCNSCRKHLCTECVTTKGVVNKTPLCHNCHG